MRRKRWKEQRIASERLTKICHCSKQHFTLARQAFIGVHPTGPWYLHDEGTPAERIVHVRLMGITSRISLSYLSTLMAQLCYRLDINAS